jgi:uncharacterized membrane protein
MAPLIILVVATVLFRAIGWLGVERLSSWRDSGRLALAVMFLFTGFTHFSSMKYDYLQMLPEPVPQSLWVIYLTGVFQIAGGICLLIPRLRRIAGICLALLLVAMFPANVYAAINEIPFRGESPGSLWIRALIQLVFIAVVWWTAIRSPEASSTNARVIRTP